MMNQERRWILGMGASAMMLLTMAVPAERVSDEDFTLPDFQDEKQWPSLRDAGVSFTVPAGFEATENFSASTPYLTERWFQEFPAQSVAVAHLRSEQQASQVFLYLGNRADLEAILAKAEVEHDADSAVAREASHQLTTADGHAVELYTATRQAAGNDAEPHDTAMLLGVAEIGDQLLLINAGGVAGEFDAQVIENLVQSLELND